MRHRPRWTLLGLGALVVVLLYTYPLWRNVFAGRTQTVAFPLADSGQREILLKMPNRAFAATAYVAMLTVVPVPTDLPTTPMPADAKVIFTSDFIKLDAFHAAEGKVTIYRLTDDSVIMSFDDKFKVTNAPDLAVYLSDNEDPRKIEDLQRVVSYLRVGPLSGSLGSQQFSIPKELPLERYRSVVLVSEALQTIYSSAPLK